MFGISGSPINRLLFNRYVNRGGRKLLRASRSSYQKLKLTAMNRLWLAGVPDFDRLLKRVTIGSPVNSDDLLPYLCMNSKQDRLWVNYSLAVAFHKAGNNKQALVFIQRVWNFSGQDERYLQLFAAIHVAVDDMASIRGAYKALGIKSAASNDVCRALDWFNAWQYVYATYKKSDEYHYDFEVLDCISKLAQPQTLPFQKPSQHNIGKIRLAYLMFGMRELNSVIVKISLAFAKFHDASKYDVTFFVPDQATLVLERKEAAENIKKIESYGWRVVLAPDSFSEVKSLHGFAKSIYEARPDILITNAALADMRHFYITALKPAPLVVGLCQGPPPQYIAPSFDWSISWSKHPMMDCPTHCTLVHGSVELPERRVSTEEAKASFGIPLNRLVIMSCGRHFKFQDQDMWIAILEILKAHPNVYYVVVGLEAIPKFLEQLLAPDLVGRVKIIERVKDFVSVLSMADVVVDTYPSGGGVTVLDAMAIGVPVVAFKNNYMREFSQTDWSPAEEFMGVPELLVDRGNFTQLGKLLARLLTDHEYRTEMSRRCRERIHETSGDPAQMVRDCEAVYLNVIKLNASNLEERDNAF
ncbi:MAG TPA: glycosyltransferase family 4 protein [Gallionella sp.]|nr:glycosyltransferase family 4 protein [Gallionella sp.]